MDAACSGEMKSSFGWLGHSHDAAASDFVVSFALAQDINHKLGVIALASTHLQSYGNLSRKKLSTRVS